MPAKIKEETDLAREIPHLDSQPAMSNPRMPPSDCLLNRFVHTDYSKYDDPADQDLPTLEQQPRLVLRCDDRKAVPSVFYSHEKANEMVQGMEIGIYRSPAPLSLACLSIPRCSAYTAIQAVDRNVMVIASASYDHHYSYLIYDSIQGSLRMIPLPEASSYRAAITNQLLIVRPRHGGSSSSSSYALVLPQKVIIDVGRERDVLLLWRPEPSPSETTNLRPCWSEMKKVRFPELVDDNMFRADVVFCSDSHAYWADLLRGAMCCSCQDILDKEKPAVEECGFIHLPSTSNLKGGGGCSARQGRSSRVSGPEAYRTMGVAGQDSVTFVSINGFHEHVDLKDRTVTIWRLQAGQGQHEWDMEHQLSLETLWGLDGFGGLPKDLSPMYPMLSKDDKDVLYIMLGQYQENLYCWKFLTRALRYVLAVDLRNKVVLGATRLTEWYGSLNRLISCDFNKFISPVALVEGAAKNSTTMQEEAYRVV